MKWTNVQFGEMEFEEKHVVTFPEGLIGFNETKKFLIVNDENSEPFRWLVSLEDSELSFPMVDPAVLLENYYSRYFSKENVTLFVVASIKHNIDESTVNLKSPIVIDDANRVGKQTVLEDDTLNVRTPITTFSSVLTE